MSEEVINKWKDVTPEDITSEPNWEEGWRLVHAEVVKVHDASEILKEYIGKRFSPNPKANFLAFIKENTGIKISENKSYDVLFSEIEKRIGKENFLSILGIKNIEEAEMRSCLADAFYKALVEVPWWHQFSPFYEKLTGEKIKIKRKVEKKEPAYRLAFSVDEKEFINAWIDLYKEDILPTVIHYKNIVIGPLGWLKSLLISGLYSDVIDIISTKFNPKSRDIIIGVLLGIVEQIGNDPNKFELHDEIGREALKHLKEVESEQDEEIRFAKMVQMIHVYFNDENLIYIINKLIGIEEISCPKVHGLYERCSDWIITKYGIFKQNPSWEMRPTEELAKLIKKEIAEEYLEPELEKYHGDYELRILEYCIRENPEKIMKRLFGMPQLRRIAEDLEILFTPMIKKEDEIIRFVLLKLGFGLPPIIIGLKDYQNFLTECRNRLERDESLSGIMTEVYRETQMVLRDIAYFYIRFLWQQGDEQEDEQEDEQGDVNEIIREKIGLQDYKPFDKLGLGHFIELMRKLNAKIREDKVLKEKFHDWFDRNRAIPRNLMSVLDEISPILSKAERHEKGEKKECLYALDRLVNLSKSFEEGIYPRVIRIKNEVTNEYGIGYFEAIDDRGDAWTIEKRWLDPSKPYFMHSKTYPVAIDPIIIEKIF